MPEDSVAKLFVDSDEDAEELFLLLRGNTRVPRNKRAKWFFDHLGHKVKVDEVKEEDEDGNEIKDISIVGSIPKYDKADVSELRVSKNTTLTYFAESYRLVFVMDLSPSAFAADEYGDICYIRIFNTVEACLKNIVKSFTFPGGNHTFQPQILVTFCAFSPFLCFTDDSILTQGVLINESNVQMVLQNVRYKFDKYINNLCTYCQPYIREWSAQRRKFRCFAKDIESALYATDVVSPVDFGARRSLKNLDKFISDFRFQMSDTPCAGFVQPDWSLISMIRMGLLGIQMLGSESAHSHLITITDGCCAIPDGPALDQIVTQLRGYSITCSFIQPDSSARGAALGHVSFPELFKFIATATFGRFMFASELEERNDEDNSGQLNFYHRTFLAWNFQRAFPQSDEPPMPEFLRTNLGTTRSHQFSQQYKTSVYKLLYVRLREGYTIKDVTHFARDGKDMVKICLTLLWKPNISIEYVILAPWRKNFQKICKISIEFYVESSTSNDFHLTAFSNEDSLKETAENMVQVDNLLIHIQMFNLYPAYYRIPRDLTQKVPFFEAKNGKIFVNSLFNKNKYKDFAQFWLPICIINESMWRKWVHMHTLRVVLKEDDPLPKEIFTASELSNEFAQIQCREAGRQVLELFNRRSTFVLLKDHCFVNILFTREQTAPQYFYITRIQYDSPCMIIKLAFLGGMSGTKRQQVVNQLREELDSLNMVRSKSVFVKIADPVVSVTNKQKKNTSMVDKQVQESVVRLVKSMDRPIERVLVRYSRVPLDVANIVRLEETSDELDIREMIIHNSVAKYLSCRRRVWELRPTFPRLMIPNATMEFILQLIVKRRLQQGFNIAYGANGIVNMIRQVESLNRDGLPRVQQCVIFGPVLTDTYLPPSSGSYDSAIDYPNYMNTPSNEELNKRLKSWPRLATEIWLEPQEVRDPPEEKTDDNDYTPEEETRDRLLEEDDAIIRSIFTFDQLMRAAESGLHAEEAYILNKVASVTTGEKLSESVYSYKDIFDPKALMDNADTRQFMLLPGLGYSETEDSVRVDARLESLLKYVQAELMKFCDCAVDALDDAFLWDIVEKCEDHFGISRFFAPENCSFDEEDEEAGRSDRRQVGAKTLIKSRNERDLLRKMAGSDESSVVSNCSDYSTNKNATSGGPHSPSEFVYDEDEDQEARLRSIKRPYDISPLSRSMTFCGDNNDLFSAAEEAAIGALNNLELENIQMRANSVPGIASDSEDNALPEESGNEDVAKEENQSQLSSFITKDLLQEFDQAIAFSSSSIYDMAHSSSSASSTTSESGGNQSGTKEDSPKYSSKKHEDKQQSDASKPIQTKKISGDRSRNASGVAEKKLSREEGVLGDSFRSRHPTQPDIEAKNEEKREAIKKFPAIPLGGFGLYARRVGSHRLILFFVPKNAKTVKLLMPYCGNSFPVFAYFVDKLRMAQRFVEKGCGNSDHSDSVSDAKRGIRTIVEDFTQKARVSTLAFLNRQLHERFTDDFNQNFGDEDLPPLDEFYLRALDSQLRAKLEPIKFNLGTFDLREYSEKVFEEYIFTKAFIAAAFSSIGQSVHVPRSVLQEATEYRCEHINLELGSIHSIMQNSCLHLQLYEQLPNKLTNSSAKLDPIEVKPIPNPKTIKKLNPRPFFRLVNGCVSNFNDFAMCFDRLLQANFFKPVPGLPDYYFFWPYRKTVLRFANVDDVSTEFADVFRAIGDHQTLPFDITESNSSKNGKLSEELRQRSESGSRFETENATQLSPADMWPLFVQFSIALIGPDGEMETAPFSTIPNCLKQLTNVCSTKALQLQTEGLTGQSLRVAVDLYVLTWPLPQQSPFRVVDPHLVYAKYQETQAQLITLHQYPAKRREWFIRMAEKHNRRLRHEASSSSDEDSDDVDLWAVQGSLDQSDDENDDSATTSNSSGESDIHNPEHLLDKDDHDLSSITKCTAHNKPISEIRREEHSKRAYNFLLQLPKVEQYAVKKLKDSIRRMLTAEQLFEWARKCEGDHEAPQPTLRLLLTVSEFINRVAPPDKLQLQITSNPCPEAIYNSFKRTIIFTGDNNEGIRLLCDRLSNLRIEYVHLRRFNSSEALIDDSALYDDEDKQLRELVSKSTIANAEKYSTFFYACFVDNLHTFKEFHNEKLLSAKNPQDAYKEPPATPPLTSDHQSLSPNTATPDGGSTPQRSKRTRASSWSPKMDRHRSMQKMDMSSSDFDSSSGDDTFDVYEPLKDTPNDRLSSSSDPTHSSRERRSRLKRQYSRHYSSSNDSLHICSDSETPNPTENTRRRRPSSSVSAKSRDKTPEAIVGSEGTIVSADQVLCGQNAPKSPTTARYSGEQETRNGFPLDWLISCGIYKDDENPYEQKLEQYCHDFWLIIHVEYIKSNWRENPQVTIHFMRRFNSPHTHLVRDALNILDEQIHTVNQQLLLDRLHLTEECDQLLIDSLEPLDEIKPIHRPIRFSHWDLSAGKMLTKVVPCADESERQRRETSVFDEDDPENSLDASCLQQARTRYNPGHFACDAVWYHWFEIHPRLQPTSRFPSGSIDSGFRTLQMGLERFAVKNRPNMYVFKDPNIGNVVYLRLFSNDPAVLEQFKEFPYKNRPEPPPDSRPHSHVLLAVHGVEKPSNEITELLRSMLEKRLHARTLSEIQDILLKNAQVRLEISDARFIQQDVYNPTNVFYFALPSTIHQLLQPFIHYFEQQALLFCNTPHFREHSGAATQSSGTSTPRTAHNSGRSPNPSRVQHPSTCPGCHFEHAFFSYMAPGAPKNPESYTPMFLLLNQPPSQGRRDIGLACIEVKVVDSNFMPVNRNASSNQNYAQISRKLQQYLMVSKFGIQKQIELFSSLTKVRRIKSPYKQDKNRESPPTAFIQLAIWQSGALESSELDERFRLCIQQALTDLYTEFGLLSMRIFDATKPGEQNRCPMSPNPPPSQQNTLQPQSSTELAYSKSEPTNLDETFLKGLLGEGASQLLSSNESSQSNFADKASSDMDLYSTANAIHTPHEDLLPSSKHSVRPISGGNALKTAVSDKHLDTALSSSIDELIPSSTAMRPTRIASVGTQVPSSIYAAASSALSKRAAMANSGRNKSEQYTSMSTPASNQLLASSPPPACFDTGEYLRDEFALSAASWFDFVSNFIVSKVPSQQQTPLNPNINITSTTNQGVLKRCTFKLECDRTMRKVMQVVYDRLCLGILGDRCVCLCRPSPDAQYDQRRLQLLWNAASLSENTERDYGRVVDIPFEEDIDVDDDEEEMEPDIDIALLAYNEKEYEDSLRYVQHQGRIKMPESLAHLCCLDSREPPRQLFLPHKEPFIPRKRLLYVVARNETLTLFLYNYSSEICEMAREIVEKTVLWHNTRSRLLCDISLHKLGITHLSSLQDNDSTNNSYLLLKWLDPETLIQHDYPPHDLKTPDFSHMPRKYAQLLFKLYRFVEPAFVGKQFALDPFDDQTQQMLTLRDDVKGKLHDHRLFSEIHKRLLKGEKQIHEDKLNRITSRSHHAHYVQSPLLLFTSWRYRIAAIRNHIGNHEEYATRGQVADGGLKKKELSGSKQQRPLQLSPVPSDRKKRTPSQQQSVASPVKITQEQQQQSTVKLLPSIGGVTKTRSKTLHGNAAQPTMKQYMKRQTERVKEPSPHLHGAQKINTTLSFRVNEQELCLLKVQYMLVEDYVDYLQKIGLTLLKIISPHNSQSYNLQYSPDCTSSPNAWLYLCRAGGIIFVNVSFIEPYFSVRFLFWNSSQLNDHMYANQKIPEKELTEMREIELLKNDIIQQSHVHSFTYDFHLRMVSKYLCGGSQVLFNPGYNTNAFLIDFLQYYGCRPPFARDCIYEERAVFQLATKKLAGAIWDYFLSNEQHFGWNVIRLKTLNNRGGSEDEFMLISKEQREIGNGQQYQLICVVFKDTTMASRRQSSTNENQIELKLYVLMVSEEMKHPLPDSSTTNSNQNSRARLESGEFARKSNVNFLASSAPSPLSIDSKKKSRDDSNSSSGSGGEFTKIENQAVQLVVESETKTEPIKTPTHASRFQPHGGTANERMLDELIAMSRNEIMADVGLQPSTSSRRSSRHTKHQPKCSSEAAPSHKETSSDLFRRRATSSDTVMAQKHLKLLASNLKQKRMEQEKDTLVVREPSASMRSSSSDAKLRLKDMKRRNSDFPLQPPQIGGSLTRLDYHAALDDVWRQSRHNNEFHHRDSYGSTNTSGSSNEFSVEKVPPRRHRQNFVDYMQKRNTDIVLPPEQVTYVHYFSNQQRRLQHLLEESAKIKKSELEEFVNETERICYVSELWKSLLSCKSSVTRQRQSTLFSSSSSKHDSGGDGSVKIPQVEMDPQEFDALMQMVCVESLTEEEPRITQALKSVNFGGLCLFLVQHYEKDKMYRYFERNSQRFLIILNPSCLDSAMMLRDTANVGAELFIVFKNTDTERRKKQNFASSAVHEQFEKLMNFITSYLWLTLVQHAPTLI